MEFGLEEIDELMLARTTWKITMSAGAAFRCAPEPPSCLLCVVYSFPFRAAGRAEYHVDTDYLDDTGCRESGR